ncbi:hypothetical protein ACWD0G_07200 [Streptomyces goshikiensis]
MQPTTPQYLIRHLDKQGERDTLAAQITEWRRERDLPAEVTRPTMQALRSQAEIVALLDTDTETFVACLHLHRTALPTPPWTHADTARPTLGLSCAATDPNAGYRLGWLLTVWARHYAAHCGYTQAACDVPLRHGPDSVGERLVRHLVDACGWDHLRTTDSSSGQRSAALLVTPASRNDTLGTFLTTHVPVVPAKLEIPS